ncbi:MAG: serine/threonine protein kinase [Ilumatobacteraceae bacterium]
MPSSDKRSEPQEQTVIAGRYRLDEHRAHGGMAEVWRATDLQLSRTVAVKLLKPHLTADATLAERFRREAVAAANLNHYNIVTVHDAIEDDGRQAVIMEFVDGKSLRELLDTNGRLATNLVVHIGTSVCAALEAAHKLGIIHRDVKPGNVLLMKDGRVMLTDFGIAKVLGEGEDLTSENIMMGTAKYLSPEQVRGDKLDDRADLYSLGIVLYECLVGKVPFVGSNDTETALARLQKEAPTITSLRPDVDPGIAAVIHKMMAREPRNRFQSCAQARQALKDAADKRGMPGTNVATRPVRDRTPPTGKVIRPKNHTPTATTRLPVVPSDERTPPGLATSGRPSQPRQKGTSRSTTPAQGTPKRDGVLSSVMRNPVVLAVLLLVVVIGGVVVAQRDTRQAEPDVSTPIADGAAVDTPIYTGPVEITGIKSFDPEGDDRVENEDMVLNVTDGDPDTWWSTTCYRSPTFGSKSGVGLVLQLNELTMAQLDVDMASREWKASIYASAENGTAASQWGQPIWQGSADAGSKISTAFTTPAQFVLIYFTEVGRSTFCSNNNPYRGSISEVRVSPAP